MKAGDSILKKCFVVLLLVFYLAIATIYLFYLPKYSPLRNVTNYNNAKKDFVIRPAKKVGNSAANMIVLLKRTYKSATDNKREIVDLKWKSASMAVFIIFGVIGLIAVLYQSYHVTKSTCYSSPNVYLSYCSLRI
jgi:hypothetical protein